MSPTFGFFNSFPNYSKYIRPSALYFYAYNTTILKSRTSHPSLISNSSNWDTKSTYPRPGSSSTRRYPRPSNSSTNYYRDNQLIYPPFSLRCTINRKPYSWSPPNSANCHSCFRPDTLNTNCSNPYNCCPSIADALRSRRSNNSSICLCSAGNTLSTRKRIMAHQAHAFHMVDPSP